MVILILILLFWHVDDIRPSPDQKPQHKKNFFFRFFVVFDVVWSDLDLGEQ